ncbi:hypothetical protein Bca4012_026403 [Brassica carinata]
MSCRSTRLLSNRSISTLRNRCQIRQSIDTGTPKSIDFSSRESIDIESSRKRRAPATQSPPEAPVNDFPIMPDIPMRDFQRFVADALQAIWSRVSRCRCMSRRSVRAHDPAAPGPSHQYHRDSSSDDEDAAEDSD